MVFPYKMAKIQRLMKQGYVSYGERTYSKTEVKKVVKSLHEKDFLAQAVNLKGTPMEPDSGVRFVVMYKQHLKKRR
jgi:hypothetical protein